MPNPTQYIMQSIQKGSTKYQQPKPTWNQFVQQNYKNVSKVPNQHPMTTLSNQYKNLKK